ncbi:COG3650 family protein [Brevundimonas subvibrioides]|uniref:COG3650 family protein n=1 Tax=Brevundimonas subvibrioides TaxID=74313 RepID=UPI0022B50657|nr:hypothetical protein [Brevundimonas subvibrioides]
MRLVLPVLTSMILMAAPGGCSKPPETGAEPAPETVTAPVVIGGVDLARPVRVLGTEPFWAIDIADQDLVLTRPDGAEVKAPVASPIVTGTTAVYTGTTDSGQTVVLTLIATECSDGMSDRLYPLTARVELGEETLNGCGTTPEALAQAPAA